MSPFTWLVIIAAFYGGCCVVLGWALCATAAALVPLLSIDRVGVMNSQDAQVVALVFSVCIWSIWASVRPEPSVDVDPVHAWALRERSRASRRKLATLFVIFGAVVTCAVVYRLFGAVGFGLYAGVVLCASVVLVRLRAQQKRGSKWKWKHKS